MRWCTDAENENVSRLTSEEHDVLASFHAAQTGANVCLQVQFL
jgi:hypothetical protein